MLKLAHISDVHIRNFKRHKEYRQSFDNLYASLKEKKVNHIVLTGDLAHTKTQISPEFVGLCAEFLETLADIAPLHLLPGNHDGNVKNLSRLDALTPIVEALGNDRIFYYKNSGIYMVTPSLDIAVFSCFDDEWPTKEDFENVRKETIKLGLYHGFVDNAVLQNGQVVEDQTSVKSFLEKVNYLMLGDIHKQQILDGSYRAAYAGSLIQQNYGESLDKGYLLWEIGSKDKHSVDFIKLPNVCPYYTLELKDDLIIPENLPYQKNARIRVLSRQLSPPEKKDVRDKLQQLYEPVNVSLLDEFNPLRQEIRVGSSTSIEDLQRLGVQEKLIREYLDSYKLSEEQLESIFEINRTYDAKIAAKTDTMRNVEYYLGEMKWDYMFSFGKDNVFDFSKRKGIVGVFGKNSVGKSSFLVDTPLLCLFNKISKDGVTKNDLMINESSEYAAVSLSAYINRQQHVVDRVITTFLKTGKRKGKPVYQGRTDLDYKVHDKNGVENCNGTSRSDTELALRKVFGSYDDFVATTVAPQWNLLDFIEKGATERQRLIGRYFGIEAFEQKNKLAKEELKVIKTKLKIYENDNFDEAIEFAEKDLEKIEKALKSARDTIKVAIAQEKRLLDSVGKHREKMVAVDVLEKDSEGALLEEIDEKKAKLKEWRKNLRKGKKLAEQANSFGNLRELADTKKKWLKVHELGDKNDCLQRDYPCLKNADCCLLKEVNCNKEEIDKLRSELEMSYKEVCNLIEKRREVTKKMIGFNPENTSYIIESIEENLEHLKEQKKAFDKNRRQIEKNKQILAKIDDFEDKLDPILELLEQWRGRESYLTRELGRLQAILEGVKRRKSEYEQLEKDYKIYDFYMKAVSKDGISRKIIVDNLDIINKELENILSHGVPFNIRLQSSENGKAIEIFFIHESNKPRIIELCGGMEKSISAVAIRAALLGVTTLPKANIFILDEPSSAFDSEYLGAFCRVLEYLKVLFDAVYIITHDDMLKDVVDHAVEVVRGEDGFARICE